MEYSLETKIKPMSDINITNEDVKRIIKNMKGGKAPGPDGIKIEIYKELVENDICLQKLTSCLQEEYNRNQKPNSWKTSKTKMIPKTTKPLVKDLRPIALTDVSYKIFMALIRDDIENHLLENNLLKETQAGFTKESRIEDNLFILQYCVEDTYKQKKPLVVISIDYKKAFDSINRGKMIDVMKKYKICSRVIDIITEIYSGDFTEICLREELKEIVEITSGIRQGCTGTTVLFKLITYIIMEALEKAKKGFKNDLFMLSSLFFADDGLLMSETIKAAENIIRMVTDISKECGLELNKNKSSIIIFNIKDQPQEIEGISVTDKIKYLGVSIDNKKNLFKSHRKEILNKAQKMANMTYSEYSVTEKSVNKILIGKTYWKNLVLPSLLHATAIMNISKTEIQKTPNYRKQCLQKNSWSTKICTCMHTKRRNRSIKHGNKNGQRKNSVLEKHKRQTEHLASGNTIEYEGPKVCLDT